MDRRRPSLMCCRCIPVSIRYVAAGRANAIPRVSFLNRPLWFFSMIVETRQSSDGQPLDVFMSRDGRSPLEN